MKIDSTKGVQRTSKTSKAKGKAGVSGAGFSSHLQAAAEASADAVDAHGGVVGAAGVGAVFAIQEVETATDGPAKKAVKLGHDMLDELEAVRIGLLTGRIPVQQLENLAKLSRSRPTQNLNPKLAAIIEEIEIRAQVELAKLAKVKSGNG